MLARPGLSFGRKRVVHSRARYQLPEYFGACGTNVNAVGEVKEGHGKGGDAERPHHRSSAIRWDRKPKKAEDPKQMSTTKHRQIAII